MHQRIATQIYLKEISVILPLYNEEGNIPVIYSQLVDVLEKINIDFELIFVDDGSEDNSRDEIEAIAHNDDRVLGISLSRNFGHQIAIVAGLEHSNAKYTIMMDCDLQHPPEVIAALYEKALEGYDIVNTIRNDSKDLGTVKRSSSKGFYSLLAKLADVKIHKSSADFRLMSRKTVEAFLKMKEKDRFTRGLVSWMGFHQTFVHFDAPQRHSGKSKYSYRKMIGFAADGIFSFSSKPLRISFYLGLIVCMLGLIYAVFVVTAYFTGNTIPGWASLMITVLFLGGVQLLSIGIIGEYLARVFNEVKNRPLYYVKDYYSKDSTLGR